MKLHYNIDMYKVRNLCIREQYYTCGDNREYEHLLLDLCDGAELEDVVAVAEDILAHSDTERLMSHYDAGTLTEVEDTILEYLLNECCWVMPVR